MRSWNWQKFKIFDKEFLTLIKKTGFFNVSIWNMWKCIWFYLIVLFYFVYLRTAFLQCREKSECLCFPAPGPSPGPRPQPPALASILYLPALASNLYLPALAPTLCLPALEPNLCLPALAPTLCLTQICIYRLDPGPEFAYTDLVSPICIYWPWPTICTHTGC